MHPRQWIVSLAIGLLSICLFPRVAMAYVGPGTGLCAAGALFAVVAGIIVALFGFVWYPLKELRRKWKQWKGAN